MGRVVFGRVYVGWNFTATSATYTEETQYVVSVDGEMRFTPAEDAMLSSGRGVVDSCTIVLRNANGRFSPLNTASPLYSYIQNGKAYRAPVLVQVSVDEGATWTTLFTGITKIPTEAGPTYREGGLVTLECRSGDELALQKRLSTPTSTFAYYHDQGYTEAQIIDAWLTAAGITNKAIDPGLLPIYWAWLDDESILEDAWQLAASCGGRLYTDPAGTVRYENFYHWCLPPHNTSQETLTPSDYESLTPVYDDRDLYNQVTVEYATRTVGTPTKLWEPDDQVSVPAQSNRTIIARLRSPAYIIDAPTIKATDAGGGDLTGYVAASCTYYAQRVVIVLSNSHSTKTAYFPTLRLTGKPVQGGPTQEKTRTSSADGVNASYWADRGDRAKSVRGNVYVQSAAQADMLARFLLHRLEQPRLSFKIGGAIGKPTRELGDRITINDPTVMSSSRDAFITAIRWKLNDAGFVQDLEAIDAGLLFPQSSYFVVGTNKLGAAGGSLTAPIFY